MARYCSDSTYGITTGRLETLYESGGYNGDTGTEIWPDQIRDELSRRYDSMGDDLIKSVRGKVTRVKKTAKKIVKRVKIVLACLCVIAYSLINRSTKRKGSKQMPYISTQEVKTIRENLKKALPGFKMSVTTRHYSTVNIYVLSGPAKLVPGQVNEWHYKNHFCDSPESIEVATKIFAVIASSKPEGPGHEDGDYGTIPDYYKHIEFGRWNKPYVQVAS